MPDLPPIFSAIPWEQAFYKDGWINDCFGGRIPGYVHAGESWPEGPMVYGFSPTLQEEIFEFESLFNAVVKARDSFTMVELGCGYGRWLLLAAGAMRRAHPEIKPRLIGVEADSTHYKWALEVAQANDLDVQMIHAAVSHEDGESDFLVLEEPQHQYGQSFIYPWTKQYVEENMGLAYDTVKVPTLSLATLLQDIEHVDYIDSDIQGAEADVFEAAGDLLNQKVARIFNETHGFPLEERLLALFDKLGWQKVHNYPPYGPSDTPYGRFEFLGGVQVFLNPRFL